MKKTLFSLVISLVILQGNAQNVSIVGGTTPVINSVLFFVNTQATLTQYRDFGTNLYSMGEIGTNGGYFIRRKDGFWKITHLQPETPAVNISARSINAIVDLYTIPNTDPAINNPPCNGIWTKVSDSSQESLILMGSCFLPPTQAGVFNPEYLSVPQLSNIQIDANITAPRGAIVYDINSLSLKMKGLVGLWSNLGFSLPYSGTGGAYGSTAVFRINNYSSQTAIMGYSTESNGIYGKTFDGTAGYFEADDPNGYALKTDGKIQLSGQGAGTNKILTSDAVGNATWQSNQVGFYANTTISTTFADNILQFVPFTVERFDDGNNFNLNGSATSPNRFVAPVDGVYHFDAKVIWTVFTGTTRYEHQLTMRIENSAGSSIFSSFDNSYFSNDEAGTNQLSMNISLNAGEKVVLAVSHNSSSTDLSLSASSSNKSFFSGYLVYKSYIQVTNATFLG